MFLFLAKIDVFQVTSGGFTRIRNPNTGNYINVSPDQRSGGFFYNLGSIYRPLEETSYWTINTMNENDLYSGSPITCGSNVSIMNTVHNVFIGSADGTRADVFNINDLNTKWMVKCQSGRLWNSGAQVQFVNCQYQCYLTLDISTTDNNRKIPIKCDKSSIYSLWSAEEGLYFLESNTGGRVL